MFNEEVLKKLISDFGELNAMLYCKMESAKNAYLFEHCIKNELDNSCTQYDFERDWWKDAENKIKNNIKS